MTACLWQIFNEIDTDGNGYITPDEVRSGFKKLGVEISLEAAKAIVSESDTDKDGRISYDGKQHLRSTELLYIQLGNLVCAI